MSRAPWTWLFQSGLSSALLVGSCMPLLALSSGLPAWTPACAAYLLFLWAMYLWDRLGSRPEDAVQPADGAGAHVHRHARSYRTLLALLLVLLAWRVLREPPLALALGASLLLSAGYLLPLPGLGRRIKELPFAKTPYLAGVVVLMPGFWLQAPPSGAAGWAMLLALASLCAANFMIFDLKDVDSDCRAGIRTLANRLPLPVLLRVAAAPVALAAVMALVLPPPLAAVLLALCGAYALSLHRLGRHRLDARLSSSIDLAHAALALVGCALVTL